MPPPGADATPPSIVGGASFGLNVRDYGAKGDSTTDDTAAFSAALTAAANAGGTIVYVPEGQYLINGTLTVPTNVVLQGTLPFPPTGCGGTNGSTILTTHGHGDESAGAALSLACNAALQSLKIVHPLQSDPKNIVPYPWTVQQLGDDASIINVLMQNPYKAVNFGVSGGRHYVRGLYGQPLKMGIFVDKCYDIGRIADVHFWPFWSNDATPFTQANGVAFTFARSDWQYVEQVSLDMWRSCVRGPDTRRAKQLTLTAAVTDCQPNTPCEAPCDAPLPDVRIRLQHRIPLCRINSDKRGVQREFPGARIGCDIQRVCVHRAVGCVRAALYQRRARRHGRQRVHPNHRGPQQHWQRQVRELGAVGPSTAGRRHFRQWDGGLVGLHNHVDRRCGQHRHPRAWVSCMCLLAATCKRWCPEHQGCPNHRKIEAWLLITNHADPAPGDEACFDTMVSTNLCLLHLHHDYSNGTVLFRGNEFKVDAPQIELDASLSKAVVTDNVLTGTARITDHGVKNKAIANNVADA